LQKGNRLGNQGCVDQTLVFVLVKDGAMDADHGSSPAISQGTGIPGLDLAKEGATGLRVEADQVAFQVGCRPGLFPVVVRQAGSGAGPGAAAQLANLAIRGNREGSGGCPENATPVKRNKSISLERLDNDGVGCQQTGESTSTI